VRSLAVLLLVVLLLPAAAAFHQAPSADEETDRLADDGPVTWRSVAFQSGLENETRATLVGAYENPHTDETRSLIAQWTPGQGLTEVYNQSGPPLVDVDIRQDGTHIVVGFEDTILLGEPGSFTNVWEESRFGGEDSDYTFYGLGATFASEAADEAFAIVSGSSLLRIDDVDGNGSLEVVHSGEGAFFRSIDFNPASDYALVEATIQRENRTLYGVVYRTDGFSNLTQEDNVAIYGRESRGQAPLNTIAFAPNGSFASFSGRDGTGASFLTWSPHRSECHPHEGGDCHDHTYRYMLPTKPVGATTCIDWHPSGDYALVTGLEEDTIGYAGTRTWAPLAHEGPDLLGCAFAPEGDQALAVGRNGTVVHVEPGQGPLVNVFDPKPGRLVAPETETRFTIGVLDRGSTPTTDVTGHLAGNDTEQDARLEDGWWTLGVNASELEDGRHRLIVDAKHSQGRAQVRFPFLVNNDAFSPSTPEIKPPEGLEAKNRDSDGLFTIRWDTVDEPVVYQIEQQRRGEATNASEIVDAGSSDSHTIRVEKDGTYFFRVRAANSYAAGNWSETVSVEVVLDSDGDGVPDKHDPQPQTPNQWGDPDGDGVSTDVEINQCSDPYDANSTPRTDDDGDGLRNGIECGQDTDPRDPNDPPPDEDDNATDPDDEGPGDPANTSDGNETTDDAPAPGLAAVLALLALAAWVRRRR